jgi:hypothetical protein
MMRQPWYPEPPSFRYKEPPPKVLRRYPTGEIIPPADLKPGDVFSIDEDYAQCLFVAKSEVIRAQGGLVVIKETIPMGDMDFLEY